MLSGKGSRDGDQGSERDRDFVISRGAWEGP